jgi:hypothetical protein
MQQAPAVQADANAGRLRPPFFLGRRQPLPAAGRRACSGDRPLRRCATIAATGAGLRARGGGHRMNQGHVVSARRFPATGAAVVVGMALTTAVFAPVCAWAQAAPAVATVYRCPGPPVLYTDALSAQEARDRGCRTIEGAPITVVQGRARPATAASGASANGSAAPRPAEARVDPAAQRARDSDARRILTEELQREEQRLAALQKDYNNGQPERRGDERNYQRYLDRVAEMKAAITRKEADVTALKRELAKLPP